MRKYQYFVTLVVCLLSVRPTWGDDTEAARSTLKGLDSISVVCDLNPDIEKFGVTRQLLLTDVELQLRKAGVKVSEDKGNLNFLYVNLNVVESGLNTYAIALEVSFEQPVRLERASGISVSAPTWGIFPVVLTAPHSTYAEFCRQYVRDLADRFANAFLSVNPK